MYSQMDVMDVIRTNFDAPEGANSVLFLPFEGWEEVPSGIMAKFPTASASVLKTVDGRRFMVAVTEIG